MKTVLSYANVPRKSLIHRILSLVLLMLLGIVAMLVLHIAFSSYLSAYQFHRPEQQRSAWLPQMVRFIDETTRWLP